MITVAGESLGGSFWKDWDLCFSSHFDGCQLCRICKMTVLYNSFSGTQFKAVVEYAPSQRVPKHLSKKDGREGTISKDPEYLQFLEAILKPVENLPSAEIQLERRDAERAGAAKDAVIVTPLMEFIRQKRAAKNGSRRILANGKPSRRSLASGSPSSSSSKRGSDKKRTSTMYVLRDSTKGASGKDKSTYTLVSKRDDHQLSGKVVTSASGPEGLEDRSAIAGMTDGGKKRILLLKGKEKEISSVSGGPISQQNAISSEKHATSSGKQNHRREPSGRIVRSILLKEPRQSSGALSEQQIHSSHVERDKRPPRPLQGQLVLKDANGTPDDRVSGNDTHSFPSEKQHDKRTRNKDRPDRVVWTPLRRSDGSYASDESLGSQSTVSGMDFSQGSAGDVKVDMTSRSEVKGLGSDRNSHTSLDNGSHKHFGRRAPSHTPRDSDGSSVEVKPSSKKVAAAASIHGSHESQKQVWVQKSSSGS
ncbi:unnamed protein product [Linum tenue]|uniref:UPF3 domain-containing protein n=1 Tax=Linum tenue TaxID=586396 RepID=A0AAV0LYF1_9ROSI|nr:unnamed protein product [Linum tenue]